MNEKLRDFVADLVTEESWSVTILAKLFSLPPGKWITTSSLCDALPDALVSYEALTTDFTTELMGMWLPHPVRPDEASLVLFYLDDELNCSVAIVSKNYLERILPAGITVKA